jgi:hypothetical protein
MLAPDWSAGGRLARDCDCRTCRSSWSGKLEVSGGKISSAHQGRSAHCSWNGSRTSQIPSGTVESQSCHCRRRRRRRCCCCFALPSLLARVCNDFSEPNVQEREISSTRGNMMLARKVADTTYRGSISSGSAKKEPAPAVHEDGARAVVAVWSRLMLVGVSASGRRGGSYRLDA